MDFSLEVIPLPVSDIDRARDFYRDRVGFHVDVDQEVVPGMRIVQLTPPGSGCSIALGDSIWEMAGGPRPAPGSYQGLQLCVADIEAARAELTGRGLEVSEPVQYAPDDGATFMYFRDPDGNGWSVQEYRRRATEPLHRVLADLASRRE
ncbi:VOC family protein [Streptomyces longwoodensis]|uniref:VOC family protein n=1 Tax=Streptomyces longwoodensis TaxID=68231 RepID=UPI002252659A|nr:VOC family protein [Streptomyces longwoodensis]MCX4998645.1 VOC family protein [Streptomyces longwoodensis]WRY88274.1 VOC family protein [Streptomyces longwoodensis]WTI47433.1 VOC family protein [Streptomyces longwoodensis]WUC73707.1 VOC family protein [Streptomyces longwoodensis]